MLAIGRLVAAAFIFIGATMLGGCAMPPGQGMDGMSQDGANGDGGGGGY